MSGTVVGAATLEFRGDDSSFQRAMRRSSAAFKTFGRDMESRLARADKAFAGGFGSLGKRMEAAAGPLNRLSFAITALGAGAVVLGTKLDTAKRSLVAVAGSTDEANRQLVELREAAKLPGLGFAEAIQGAVRLQAVGVAANDSIRYLKAFGNAIATTGGGKAELDRVTVQLGQLSAKGKLLAQDLRPIIEAAPAVGKALKDAFGSVDAQEIEELGLTTGEFLDRLTRQLEKLPRVTGGPKNAFENLSDAALIASDSLGRVLLPASAALADTAAKLFAKIEALEPSTIAWGVSLGIVAAAAGPLLFVTAKLTIAAAALSTALSVGLLPLIGVGGIVIAGLGLLAAGFIKSKLEALAAAGAVQTFNDQLKSTSQLELYKRLLFEENELAKLQEQKQARLNIAEFADTSDLDQRIQFATIRLNGLRDRMTELRNEAVAAAAGVDVFKRALSTQPFELLLEALDAARVKLQRLEFESGLPQTKEDAVALTNEIKGVRAQIVALEGSFGSFGEARARALATLTPQIIDAAAAAERVRRLNNAMPQPVQLIGRASGATSILPGLSKVRQEALAAAAALNSMSPAMDALQARMQGIALAGADAFADFALGSKNAMHDFVNSAIRDLTRLAARLAAITALRALFPQSAFVDGLATAAGLAKRASGGPVMKNRAYLVGERGPELFVPAGAGAIVANNSMGRGTAAFDLSSLPPYPRRMSPGELAVDDWWRQAFSAMSTDHKARGGR